jgi:hypothetical protein
MKLLKKLTVKGVFGDVQKAVFATMIDGVIQDGVVIPVMRVVGKCNRYDVKTTDLGDSICLKGSFMATSPDGEEFRAGTCYLPDTASEAVAGAIQDDVESVEFAFDVAAVTDGEAVRGYFYEVTPLIEPTEDDALNRLAESLPKALAAPAEKAKK